ncbi:hypothetical protein JAAARDRAFT_51912 [Jaapia argillacea MUCL 33604]|uniref:DUF6532 domain-containing protein n=1 Tax=Jaapia argillacea MUCL 33604 TaxID=933084 RepID=A0A067P2Q3_9AGAM|nr:hypothetical protein JAAARDRAFT_51912 [Jaapia argillacea MUCL 33604]
MQVQTIHSLLSQYLETPSPLSTSPISNTPQTPQGSRKQTSPDLDVDDEDDYDLDGIDPEEYWRLKKAERNSKCTCHYHYQGDEDIAGTIQLACDLLKVYFSTINPFPTPEERKLILKSTYQDALQQRGLSITNYPYGADEAELLSYEESKIQTSLKKIVLHKVDPVEKLGMFCNAITAESIHDMWFKHHNDIGYPYQKEFNPIPQTTIVLWSSGTWVMSKFMKSYSTQYTNFLKALSELDDKAVWTTWC